MKFKINILWKLMKNIMFYGLILYCLIEYINGWQNVERWKWGYYSLDWIPPTIILALLGYVNLILWISRVDRELKKLGEGK